MTAEHIGKRPEQIRRWTNARRLSIKNFIAVVGDKPITEVTRDDARLFQGWWSDRVKAADGGGANAANQQIGQVAAMVARVADELRIDIGAPFTGPLHPADQIETEELHPRVGRRPTACAWRPRRA